MTIVTNPARPEHEAHDEIEISEERSPTVEERPNPLSLFDNEYQSDVTFVVGINGDTSRYPGHRRILAATSPVFAHLLEDMSNVIVVDYIDRRGFEQLMRYYYCEPTQLNSVTTARCSLDAACKFLCSPLTERCVRRLDELLDAGTALEILPDLRYLCTGLPGSASAPPLPAFSNDHAARSLAQCSRWCDSLAHNTLLVIDDHAEVALADERIEELCYEDLALIVRRDTLRISSELVLVEALSRWSTSVLKRTKKELTSSNKRVALGSLSYSPRYLLLQGEDLDRALSYELLEPLERSLVIARARKLSSPVPSGADQEALLRHWSRSRPPRPTALPVHLSPRSSPPIEEPEPSKLCGQIPILQKQPSFDSDDKSPDKGCCASFGEGLLRALICLCD